MTKHAGKCLAARRGAAQHAVLDLGAAREPVAVRGYGQSYPVASNERAETHQLNRRVEIVLSDDRGRTVPR